MRVHLVNPSDKSSGVGVIAPRWLSSLAAATPVKYGDPLIVDETLERFSSDRVRPGDVVGIGIQAGNALRGMAVGRMARERGASVVYCGLYATLYPEEPLEVGHAHSVIKGDCEQIWPKVIADLIDGREQDIYEAGHISADHPSPALWQMATHGKSIA